MPRLRNAAVCCRALAGAMEWLDKKADDSESWPAPAHPISIYYKLPFVLAMNGRPEHCRRLLSWAKANLLLPNGDCRANVAVEGQPAVRATLRQSSWLAMAAHLTSRYDLSLPITRFLLAQQGGVTGAVYDLDESGKREETADVRTVASVGSLFLAAGFHENARRAGAFLARAVQLQADEETFYLRMDSHGRMMSHFPREQAANSVLQPNRKSPQLSYLAMPVIFLARLHQVTGEEQWLDTAMDYFLFTDRLREEALLSDDSAGLAWAGASLYGITRRRMFYDAAEKITQAWIQKQKTDGSWRLGRDEGASVALTVQNVLCLTETLREAQ